MHKQVVFPEFLGESEIAVVIIIPSLQQELGDLFERFYAGDEIDYRFTWDLVVTNTAEYLVVLEIDWDEGEGLLVAFSPEMWEFINLIAQKQNLVLVGDWGALEEGAALALAEGGEYRPYALLIRDAHSGLDKLYDHVKELAAANQEVPELARLQLILEGAGSRPLTYH
ncbi:hypothetical protein [Desulforamulus hydrothermalis]|uniref:Uncharacterized protein n=1 Tax=Desulforamulus hydrothermalis Lam5 = DSM 18033 TaxID=1121428 RepID=K8E0L8_9FIRM|nr:hypothetical protein [Desulforamulus hydrothermalis]CCO09132.1 conserved hypothetical protein [Desulforamulus hydrothermalis Lam5 = DSM 18033]SHH11973.1 hypothetical protein SAMN02745177_01515 [Desulforamulus hydrothermalis Lam5 = DSM 18033]